MIPTIDIEPLFGPAIPVRDRTDAAIMQAAARTGFMAITGPPDLIAATQATRADLLRLFALPPEVTARLSRRKFAPGNPNVYRGWFPLQPGFATYKEGIDIGPDIVRRVADAVVPASPSIISQVALATCMKNDASSTTPKQASVAKATNVCLAAPDASDPLQEPTPLPEEAALPGWREAAAQYYRAMEMLGGAVMRAVARGLGLPETQFEAAFQGGISTLRLIHYPVRPDAALGDADSAWVIHQDRRRKLSGAAHVDSGFVTLLAQDGVPGLQAQDASGAWVDVPPLEGTLAVNFGAVLERWTGGRIRATRHRVLESGQARCSIPFFYEPRVDAVIAPLPGGPVFEPFEYGDHLWTAMTGFVEFQGLESARQSKG